MNCRFQKRTDPTPVRLTPKPHSVQQYATDNSKHITQLSRTPRHHTVPGCFFMSFAFQALYKSLRIVLLLFPIPRPFLLPCCYKFCYNVRTQQLGCAVNVLTEPFKTELHTGIIHVQQNAGDCEFPGGLFFLKLFQVFFR